VPNSIKRELNDGMIRELRKRSLTREIRYYSLTLGSDFLGMESCGINGVARPTNLKEHKYNGNHRSDSTIVLEPI